MADPITPEALHVLRHSLGVGERGNKPSYRNHFVTGDGTTDYPICMGLVDAGLMKRHPGSVLTGGDWCFTVTKAGRDLVEATKEPEPKLTRSQRRYREFLDHDTHLKFIDWLRRYA